VKKPKIILAIETSCDETAVAVVKNGTQILSNIIYSQILLHKKTGGVVPEVAAREHIKMIKPAIEAALKESRQSWKDIDGIAVTKGPGLIGSLLVGVETAKTLAYVYRKPFYPVNHIIGHIYANFLERKPSQIKFPFVVLTASGGHNELVLVKGHGKFQVLGETRDDAAGEAFDKAAKILDLGYPGGPAVSKAAEKGNPQAFDFPRSYLEGTPFEFSFSGMKSALLRLAKENKNKWSAKMRNDLAATFQNAVTDVLAEKTLIAAKKCRAKQIHLAGGVSANQMLRQKVQAGDFSVLWPKQIVYCTDNAAMIAAAAYFSGQKVDPLKLQADPSFYLR